MWFALFCLLSCSISVCHRSAFAPSRPTGRNIIIPSLCSFHFLATEFRQKNSFCGWRCLTIRPPPPPLRAWSCFTRGSIFTIRSKTRIMDTKEKKRDVKASSVLEVFGVAPHKPSSNPWARVREGQVALVHAGCFISHSLFSSHLFILSFPDVRYHDRVITSRAPTCDASGTVQGR